MKKLLPLLCFLLLLAASASAQFPTIKDVEDTAGFVGFAKPPKQLVRANVIKTSPVPFLIGQIPFCGEFRVTYERAITRHHSVLIGGSLNYPGVMLAVQAALDSSGGFKLSDYAIIGGRIILGYRWYPLKKKKEAPAGFFVGPYFSYNVAQVTYKPTGDKENIHFLNASLVTGYQIVKKNGFIFEFFGGLGYRRNFVTGYDARTNRYISAQPINTVQPNQGVPTAINNVKLVLQINLGYAF